MLYFLGECSKQQTFKICKAESDSVERRNRSTITVGDFNLPLSIIDRTGRQKISKAIENLNDLIKLTFIEHSSL